MTCRSRLLGETERKEECHDNQEDNAVPHEIERHMVRGYEYTWPPPSVTLRAVASTDPRPDTVEELLYLCPQQAHRFGETTG